jgi:diguanylate cyclase (GGDEF)-like protein
MLILTITFGWLAAVLAVDMLFGFGLGWYASSLCRGTGEDAGDSLPQPTRESDDVTDKRGSALSSLEESEAVLEEIRGGLAVHAQTLATFEDWLTPGELGIENKTAHTAAVVKIEQIRQANRSLEDMLDEKFQLLQEMTHTYRSLLQGGFDQLVDYRSSSRRFDDMLAELNVDEMIGNVAESVVQIVHELRQENQSLRTELDECNHKLAEQTARAEGAETDARIDVLTQLPNRRAFEEKLRELRSLHRRRGQPYVLVLFDVDSFKLINDTYGHSTGDAVLAVLGRSLRNCRRATDHISRFGGEEFAVLVPLCTKDQVEFVAERYRKRIAAASLRYDGQRLQVTASAGAAAVSSDEGNDTVVERADMALYAAKKAGRNCTCVDDGQSCHTPSKAVSTPL